MTTLTAPPSVAWVELWRGDRLDDGPPMFVVSVWLFVAVVCTFVELLAMGAIVGLLTVEAPLVCWLNDRSRR